MKHVVVIRNGRVIRDADGGPGSRLRPAGSTIGPTSAEKIKNAETMYGTGSRQHKEAIKRFGSRDSFKKGDKVQHRNYVSRSGPRKGVVVEETEPGIYTVRLGNGEMLWDIEEESLEPAARAGDASYHAVQGQEAKAASKPESANPYPLGGEPHRLWQEGYRGMANATRKSVYDASPPQRMSAEKLQVGDYVLVKGDWLEVIYRHWGGNNKLQFKLEGNKTVSLDPSTPVLVSARDSAYDFKTERGYVVTLQSAAGWRESPMFITRARAEEWLRDQVAKARETVAGIISFRQADPALMADSDLPTIRRGTPERGVKIPPPSDPRERADWEAAVERRQAEGKGKYVGDGVFTGLENTGRVRMAWSIGSAFAKMGKTMEDLRTALLREGATEHELSEAMRLFEGARKYPNIHDARDLPLNQEEEERKFLEKYKDLPSPPKKAGDARSVDEVKRDLVDLKREMKSAGIRKVSPFNGGLSREELNYNTRRFALETELERLEAGSHDHDACHAGCDCDDCQDAARDASPSVEELRRKGFKKVSSGSLGWTEWWENEDTGEEYKVEYGPQPGMVQSVQKVR